MNENQKGPTPNVPQIPKVAPTPMAVGSVTPVSTGPDKAPDSPGVSSPTSAQFERLLDKLDDLNTVLLYGLVANGVIFGSPNLTATKANMKRVGELAKALAEVVEQG